MKTIWNTNFYHPRWINGVDPVKKSAGQVNTESSANKAVTVYLMLLAEGAKTSHQLIDDMNLSRITVIKHLRQLIDAGLVVTGQRKVLRGGSGYETYLYEVK